MTRLPAPLLFVVSGLTQYVGAAVAVGLFAVLPAPTVAWLRVAVSALVLLPFALVGRRGAAGRASDEAAAAPVGRRRALGTAAVFGVALALMNVSFYVAIDHLPLGTAVAVEFLGPVAVAAVTGRGGRERGAIAVAAAGVVLLAGVTLEGGADGAVPVLGLAAALGSAAAWAAYIVLGRRVARQAPRGLTGLAVAMAAGTLVLAPLLAADARPVVADPRLALLVLVVGVCSSVVPYGLEQVVLRRVSAATFAVLLALLPATATLVGLVGLGQRPAVLDLVGLALVSVAIALTARRSAPEPEAGTA